jgi:hypothetical protein
MSVLWCGEVVISLIPAERAGLPVLTAFTYRPSRELDVAHGECRLLVCSAGRRPRHAHTGAGMLTVATTTGAGDFHGCHHGRWSAGRHAVRLSA